jgi:hypothetical protein
MASAFVDKPKKKRSTKTALKKKGSEEEEEEEEEELTPMQMVQGQLKELEDCTPMPLVKNQSLQYWEVWSKKVTIAGITLYYTSGTHFA